MGDRLSVRRHDLLYLERTAPPGHPDRAAVAEWTAAGRPVIVRRPGLADGGRGVHCGLPLPVRRGGARIAFVAPLRAVLRRAGLPLLEECLDLLPGPRKRRAAELLAACRERGFAPEVFGSLAWERMTGLRYLQGDSDLDLRFRVGDPAEMERLAGVLGRFPALCARLCDVEVELWNGMAFSWREFAGGSPSLLMKTVNDVFLIDRSSLPFGGPPAEFPQPEVLAFEAEAALREELESYPKPGLVSYADGGSHGDMDAARLAAGIAALRKPLREIAAAGARAADAAELRRLGVAAERRMLAATGGVNTHRGAIFAVGLLVAAAGYRSRRGGRGSLGTVAADLWGAPLAARGRRERSNGNAAARRYGCGGAREEAAAGFPSVYLAGLPAFAAALPTGRRNAARIHAFFAMLERAGDTTILHRGGRAGLEFARASAREFNRRGGVGAPGWEDLALETHREFVARNLSCGGVADLLAATIFVHRMEGPCRA